MLKAKAALRRVRVARDVRHDRQQGNLLEVPHRACLRDLTLRTNVAATLATS